MCPRRLIRRAAAAFIRAALMRLKRVARLSLDLSKSSQITSRLVYESAPTIRTSSGCGRATRPDYATARPRIRRENLNLLVVYGECELNSMWAFCLASAGRVPRYRRLAKHGF